MTTALPTTEVYPVVYFDGVCGMCNKAVDFIIRRDRRHTFHYAPLQGETARRLALPEGELLNSLVYEDQTGHYRKTDAVWRILVGIGGVWGCLGWMLRLLPRFFRDWGYDLIARNRYRIFGKKESCRLPTREERGLFLP